MNGAPYINRFYVQINADGIARLTFKELLEGAEHERAAAAMTVADAEALAKCILETVQRAKVARDQKK